MTIPLDTIPRFDTAQALDFARREFGLTGAVRALPSERDQNFEIAARGGRRFVLKIANSQDDPSLLDFQNQAMRRVAASAPGCAVQSVIPARDGREMATIVGACGASHCVRLMSWVDGRLLSAESPLPPGLLESIGECMARVGNALEDLRHPAMRRRLQWDIRHAPMAREHAALLPRGRRPFIEAVLGDCEALDWDSLRHGVIHGDANDNNVLVTDGRMTGLLDFGDLAHTATICDLAIVLAYTLIGEGDPLAAAARLVAAYQRARPLDAAERCVLPTLLRARLAMSVCYSAHNRLRHPDDPYQVVSESGAWALLDRLEAASAAGALRF